MFFIKSYQKRDLARLYFPFVKDDFSALKALNRMIDASGDLRKRLRRLERRKQARFFSAESVRLITRHLGEP